MTNHEDLKKALLEDLITRVKDGEEIVTKSGDVAIVRAPAGVLQAALGYLKAFGTDGDTEGAAELSDTIKRYSENLPFRTLQGGKK